VASYLQFYEQVHMSSPPLNTRVQSLVAEYGVFWQFWPQFEQTNGERHLVGFEVELIGSQVCPDFCVNDQVLFLGMGRWGRGHFPFPSPSL